MSTVPTGVVPGKPATVPATVTGAVATGLAGVGVAVTVAGPKPTGRLKVAGWPARKRPVGV